MSKASPIQTSFNGGELSERMEGRIDFEKYPTGCAIIENFKCTAQGPLVRRGGTHYVDDALNHSYVSRLGRFEFSYDQAFLLEFNNDRLGFFTDRGRLIVSRVVTNAADNGAGLIRITSAAHGFFTGDLITVASVGGVPNATGTWVITRIDANNFDLDGSTFAGAYTVGGTAVGNYTLQTVYTDAGLLNADSSFDLSMLQSGDVVYIAGGSKPPQKLSRLANTNWTLAEFQPVDGPYMDPNTTETTTVYASAATGSVTLTASASIFTANHVGALIRLEVQDLSSVKPWEPAKAVTAGDLRRSDGKTYEAQNSDTTGSVRPTHTKGTAFDGSVAPNMVEWEFMDPGYGVARITAYGSGTSVTATVLKRMPAGVVGAGNPSWRWQFGAWGLHNEYPIKVTLWRDRLIWAGLRTVWMSVTSDYESMAPDDEGQQTTESAITIVPGGTENNAIRWMQPSDVLLVGTSGAEFAVGPQTDSEPLGPANIKAPQKSVYGGRNTVARAVSDAVFFIDKSGRKVRESSFDDETGVYSSRDVTILADHVTGTGIVDLAFQGSPDPILWGARADGQAPGFTYESEQNVYGWHRHILGGSGIVEAVQTLPSPDGSKDDLWLSVKRTVDGATVRYIEWMDHGFRRGDSIASPFYVDSGLTYEGGPASITIDLVTITALVIGQPYRTTVRTTTAHQLVVGDTITISGMNATGDFDLDGVRLVTQVLDATRFRVTYKKGTSPPTGSYTSGGTFSSKAALSTTISGLEHLEGMTVSVLANGAVHPDRVVSGGEIELEAGYGTIHIGLPYVSRMKTMRIEAGADDGTAQGKTKRIDHVVVRFIDTLGGFYGPSFDQMDEFQFRSGSDLMDAAPPMFSGDKEVSWNSGYETDGQLCIEQRQPLPMTIAALMPRMETAPK